MRFRKVDGVSEPSVQPASSVLRSVHGPADLRRLDAGQLETLAAEIRAELVACVSRTGGHLGPNLGVVELTIALHRVFDSPRDTLIWDTGHQSYVHKLLTGRHDGWERLKLIGGLSGYPSRAESEHDHVENSHASTSLSWADGIARAYALTRQRRHVVAVIGDGALTGGMAWEALNNIAAAKDRNLVIVVNDNGRSYAPTIGGVADRLASLRLRPSYERVLEAGKQALHRTPLVGGPAYAALHALKAGVKDALSPQELFSDLGIKYFGPVEGHGVAAVESALRRARGFGGPVIVHVVTQKGKGYPPAENDEAEQMHSPAAFDPMTGLPTAPPTAGWTGVFAEELVKIGTAARRRRRDHRGDAGADRSRPVQGGVPRALFRRRDRRAARADLGRRSRLRGPAPGRRALLDVPQPGLRPAADGRRRCIGRQSRSCSTGRASPATTGRRTTACGTCRCWASCRACGWPPRGTRRRCARSWPRPSRSTTGPRRCGTRRAR